ncbi:MAG: T9SS type A sorting domain-containing protein, partial [Firmicutes bacterium]|nr:T9SS type A sorting domain-containing protein [Bacillota bacterium]
RRLSDWLDPINTNQLTLNGKGVWDCTPIPANIIFTTTITSNTTWNSNVAINGTITINPNVTLTIQNITAEFSAGSSIIIKPGGKLVINGGTLTNACIDDMWKGIIVEGTALSQTSSNQGIVELTNATIENALCGIKTMPATNSTFSGAIIYANNSTFINNLCAVEYTPYVYTSGGLVYDNIGYFNNCNFIIDEDNFLMQNGKSFDNHVKMQSVVGITFAGCIFKNEPIVSGVHIYSNGMGINAMDAGFKVREKCSVTVQGDCTCPVNNSTPSFFQNFDTGIRSFNVNNPFNVLIDQSQFNHNAFSVSITASNNYQLTRNNFNNIVTRGFFSNGSSGYKIEENNFQGIPVHYVTNRTGMEIKNSGAAENRIYKNNFNVLDFGITSSEINANPQLTTGLQFICNNFTGITREISTNSNSTIRSVQGSSTIGADNTFINTHTNGSNLFINNGQTLNYYHSSGNNKTPTKYTSNVIVNGNAGINNCSSTFCNKKVANGLRGDQDMLEIYQTLQNEYDILLNEFECNDYFYILENINSGEFSEEQISQVLQMFSQISEISNTMREISDGEITAILQDSITDTNKLKLWYQLVRTPIAKYSLAETHFFLCEFEQSDAVLYSIPEMFVFSEKDYAEHANYMLFHNFKKQLQLSERSWADLTEVEISRLQNIAEANTGRSSVMAKGVLCFFYNICEDEIEIIVEGENPDLTPKFTIDEHTEPIIISESGLSIYPNPAQTEITVSTNKYDIYIKHVELYDIFGQLIIKQIINKTTETIPIGNINDGVYVLKVYLSGGEVEIIKMVKKV